MAGIITDTEIQPLLSEAKPLPQGWEGKLRDRPKSSFKFSERDLHVTGENGGAFRLVQRRNRADPLDFSVIMVYESRDGPKFVLRRHNGPHPSRHTNKWERARELPNAVLEISFHIHMATERYQLAGLDMDGYAETTNRYSSFDSALSTLLDDTACRRPPPPVPRQLGMGIP